MDAEQIIAQSKNIVITTDHKGYLRSTNPAFHTLLGYPEKEVQNQKFEVFVHPEDIEKTNEQFNKLIQGQESTDFENRFIHKNGELVYILWNSFPLNSKEELICGIGNVITDQKQAELSVIRSKQLLETSQSIAHVGRWELDLLTGANFWTAETYRIHETSPAEFNPTVDAGIEFYLPESQEILKKALQLAIEKGEGFDLELRLKTVKGRLIHVRTTAEVTFHEGRPVKLTGAFQDITDRKTYEEKIEESESKISSIINSLEFEVCVIDQYGNILQVNEAWNEFGRRNSDASSNQMFTDHNYFDVCRANIDNKDSRLVLEGLQNLLEGEIESFNHEYPCHTPEKDQWFMLRASLMKTQEKQIIISHIDITERVNMEVVQKKLTNQSKLAIETAKLGVWILDVRSGRIDWNDRLLDIYGISRSEFEEDPERWKSQLHPDDSNYAISQLDRLFVERSVYGAEFRILRKDGEVRYIDASGKAILNQENEVIEFIGLNRDVTTQKQQENALKESEDHLRRAQQIAKIGSWHLDLKTGVVTWTEELHKMFGVDPSMPAPMWSEQQKYYTKKSWDVIRSAVEKTSKDGEPYEHELKMVRKDKSTRWILSRGEALKDDSGYIYALSGIAQDITLKKENILQLEKAKMKAEEADKSKSAFLANMSHEIRTPLNAIIGFSRLLDDDQEALDKETYIDQIHSNSEHLLSLVDDILTISRVESEQTKIVNQSVRLHQLIQEIFDYHSNHIKSHKKENVVLELCLPKNTIKNDFIELDPIRLKEILHNLICNAIKFTTKGTIEIGYSYKLREVEFFVLDEGIGIPKTHLEKIFERFEQAPDIAENYGGTGLGLAICKELIDKMGGRIWVESKVNVGSKFSFTIPRISSEERTEIPIKEESQQLAIKPGKKVLIADDSPSVQLFYKTIMKKYKIDAYFVKSGLEALDCYNKNMDSIDLVLMDIRMPGMDGIETMKRLKKINPGLTVIAQTAFTMKTELEKFQRSGFDGCLTKPIPEAELIKLIKSQMSYT